MPFEFRSSTRLVDRRSLLVAAALPDAPPVQKAPPVGSAGRRQVSCTTRERSCWPRRTGSRRASTSGAWWTAIRRAPSAPTPSSASATPISAKTGSDSLMLAVNEFREFLQYYPTNPRADYAQYRLALAQMPADADPRARPDRYARSARRRRSASSTTTRTARIAPRSTSSTGRRGIGCLSPSSRSACSTTVAAGCRARWPASATLLKDDPAIRRRTKCCSTWARR